MSAEALFGEAPSRILVTVGRLSEEARERLARAGVPFFELGTVGGDRLVIEGALDLPVSELEATWERTIPAAMEP